MAIALNLGFARMGARRELKKAAEAYWSGKTDREDLLSVARGLRQRHWAHQTAAGFSQVPSGDFSLYDHVLDTAWMLDAIPARFRSLDLADDLDLYFAMARGSATQALEMTKWFDTNYHYLVPEFTADQEFRLARNRQLDAYREAKTFGFPARPVILGPLSFLLLGKVKQSGARPLALLDRVLGAYEELLKSLQTEDVPWVQFDEPVLATDLDDSIRDAFARAYIRLAQCAPRLQILLATYFGSLRENLPCALRLPVHAIHLDLVRGPDQLETALSLAPDHVTLSLGVVDGRNIWKTDLARALTVAERAAEKVSGERIMIAPSCSLLHVPIDLSLEQKLPAAVKDWLAFGLQKLAEVATITRALNQGREAVRNELEANRESLERRRTSELVHDDAVRERLAAITKHDFARASSFPARKQKQQAVLCLPLFPTTTIGSFPQTAELRRQRARMRSNEITAAEYDGFIRNEISHAIAQQEKLGLDVLVHGEPERNDMVEYFGELLHGFAFTENGWVQSYGSRCVKPPILYGDVTRREPMTVDWWRFAQNLASRPMKGMLTGPVTVLQWSFVRDDQPRADTCFQLALAIRDEILDLEAAGCRVIQIDEPALREGLPLRKSEAPGYLRWAVDAFRLATAGVRDETQIHTHMCYAEFNEIVDSIAAMDADVISMESARSQMELLDAFAAYGYGNDIGPGVYDIHSPRVPSTDEMYTLLERALDAIPAERLWVNPDCGLKTRRWEEVTPALEHLVAAAIALRNKRPAHN
ncbi:MAG TPA: 5-methyltetrahydropteroyltriglutamate--homocysteine S-methyltransferase [Bryobacteraceae bacterium]|jgi:5-methyltetrahydropteroyltriglutamate--homocysteine methyltransferase